DLERVADQIADVGRDERMVLPQARELLDPLDGLRAVARRLLDDAERAPRLRVLGAHEQELRAAEDRAEDVVEIVRDPSRHLAERFQPLRSNELRVTAVLLARR